MKKKIITLLALLMFAATPITAVAEETDSFKYEIGNTTVQFEEDCPFDRDTQRAVAEYLVYGDDGAEPYNLLCSIFGHNYESTTSTAIVHKARATAPRCRKDSYEVSVCSRCGDTQKNLVRSVYFACCT